MKHLILATALLMTTACNAPEEPGPLVMQGNTWETVTNALVVDTNVVDVEWEVEEGTRPPAADTNNVVDRPLYGYVTVQQTPEPTYYRLDHTKVRTLEDVIVILSCFEITVTDQVTNVYPKLKPYLVEIENPWRVK